MSQGSLDWAMGVLRSLVIENDGVLPVGDVENIWEFIEAGELGLAFETLCTQLYEYDLHISVDSWNKLADLGGYLGLDSQLWFRVQKV